MRVLIAVCARLRGAVRNANSILCAPLQTAPVFMDDGALLARRQSYPMTPPRGRRRAGRIIVSWTRRRERNPPRDARSCSRVSVATVNRRPFCKFYWRAIVSQAGGSPLLRSARVYARGKGGGRGRAPLRYLSGLARTLQRLPSLALPSRPFSRAFVAGRRARSVTSINFQWILVKRFTGCYTRRHACEKIRSRPPRRADTPVGFGPEKLSSCPARRVRTTAIFVMERNPLAS